ncbi:MAG: hypothetical protein WEE89_21210 [Gemmatimonadota bacterium]
MITLLDETRAPSVRETMGRLLGAAQTADLAIANVRLAAVDLQAGELARLQHCRLLLARFDAAFAADAQSLSLDSLRAEQFRRLLAFAESGRLSVRSASAKLWLPDFSIYRGLGGKQSVLVLGAHYFKQPYPPNAAALTCVIRDEAAVEWASQRYEALWDQSHDVLPVIAETLAEALECAAVK